MDIVCSKCQKKIKIPDQKLEKIPNGQVFTISCPNCKNKISVKNESDKPVSTKNKTEKTAAKPAPAPPKPETPPDAESPASQNGDLADNGSTPENPFEFLEEGAKTAIICESDPKFLTRIKEAMDRLQYHISVAENARDALKQMRSHDFDLVILNERFGTRDPDMNHVLKHLQQLQMIIRRNMFIALISERFRTGDNMQAYNKSVNVMIHKKDIDNIEKVLERSIKDNDRFYRVYKEMLKKIKGR